MCFRNQFIYMINKRWLQVRKTIDEPLVILTLDHLVLYDQDEGRFNTQCKIGDD